MDEYSLHYVGYDNDSIVLEKSIDAIVDQFLNNRDSLAKDINTSLLEDLISSDIYIKKAEVYLDVRGVLNIYVYLREPLLRVLRNNKIYYLDSDGVLLSKPLNIDRSLLIFKGELEPHEFNDLIHLVNKIYNHDMLNRLIGGITYDDKVGYVLSSRICDLKINIGMIPILDKKKINMIKLFFSLLSNHLDCNYCNSINIENHKQIICVK